MLYIQRIFLAYDHIADGFFDENLFFAKSKLYSRFGEIDYLAVSIIGLCLSNEKFAVCRFVNESSLVFLWDRLSWPRFCL